LSGEVASPGREAKLYYLASLYDLGN